MRGRRQEASARRWGAALRIWALSLALGVLSWSCAGCGGEDNAAPNNAAENHSENNASSSALPWSPPFLAPAWAPAEVTAQATALRDEFVGEIPASTREEITAHVAMFDVAGLVGEAMEIEEDEDDILLDPDTVSEAWVMAGVSAVFQDDLGIATWCFSNAVLADPEDEQALNQLGWALLALERHDEARGVLLRGVEIEPRLWSLWSNLGYSYAVEGDPERAIYYLGRGLEHHPESVHMHVRRGELLLEQGDVVSASAHATHAKAIAPRDPEVEDFAEAVEAAGGGVAAAPPAPAIPGGAGMRDVMRDYNACVEDATLRYSQAMAPFIEAVLLADQSHRLRVADLNSQLAECKDDCGGVDDSCWDACDFEYCSAATIAEVLNHQRHLEVASADASYNAAFRTRMRGCAYNAAETYEESVTEESIQDFLVYVSQICQIEAESSRRALREELDDLADRLPVMTGCLTIEAVLDGEPLQLNFDLESLGISVGMDVCLDGFVCLGFGETSIGFSVGVNFASGGVTIDYGDPDVIFSVGAGHDVVVGAAGVDLKLSIRHGIGVSPSVKIGTVIRSTYSRDFWLLSF